MCKIQVEVRFTNKLESIRVDYRLMEVPSAIKTKPIGEWFIPAKGRIAWKGLPEEIRKMDCSGTEKPEYSFQFNGPVNKKCEFLSCVKQYHLGEESQQESERKTAQEYLENAKNNSLSGNETAAAQNYKIAAEEYDAPEAQYELAFCYQKGTGVEKNEKKLSNGIKKRQKKVWRRHSAHWENAIIVL